MTDDEQQIAQAIARAFETLSERLSKELEDAFNQMAQQMGRAQKQQYEPEPQRILGEVYLKTPRVGRAPRKHKQSPAIRANDKLARPGARDVCRPLTEIIS